MKIIRSVSMLCIIAAAFLHSGCEKGPFDYRKKYNGYYTVTLKTTSWKLSGAHESSTAVTKGVVDYDKSSRNKIIFHFGNEDLELKINKHGVLYLCGQTIGKFKTKDKFYFAFGTNTCGKGVLGGGETFEYNGIR